MPRSMFVADRLTLDAPTRTSAGYMAVRAKVARTGTYDYAGHEVDPENKHGLRDKAVVKVYRPGDQVFDRKSLASFIGKPITNNHPTEAVTADNWRDHARGTIMGAVRDGEYVSFDLLLTDSAAIAAVEGGKRELSNGYATDLKFEPGTAPDGTAYDAVQTSIAGNHIAIVDRGRAGPDCRITDRFAACDANPAALAALTDRKEPVMAGTIIVDGLPVSLADEAAVRAVIEKKDAAIADAVAARTKADSDLAEANGKVTALEAKVKDAEDKSAPAALDALVAARSELVAKAKAVVADVAVDGKTDAEIRKAVVLAKLGDAAKDMDDAAITGAFAVIAADAKPETKNIAPRAVVANDAAASLSLLRVSRYN